ncbi:MAG: hypothetical protein F6K61_19005 [Sphaerospermopsis sp. SIO1G1]|nr:hypothetical protein [Sphaerospermopsis sp. SIO1G1]
MTKSNIEGISNQGQKKFHWPVWFPYPSSWLKALVLGLFIRVIVFVFTHTGEFGMRIANFTNSPELFIIFAILAILSPIFVITFTHHLFHIIVSKFIPSIQAPEIGKPKGLIPGIVSIWEGLSWLVICLSTLISCLLLVIIFPISNFNFYQPVELYTKFPETFTLIFTGIWIINVALLYQIDFLFKK